MPKSPTPAKQPEILVHKVIDQGWPATCAHPGCGKPAVARTRESHRLGAGKYVCADH